MYLYMYVEYFVNISFMFISNTWLQMFTKALAYINKLIDYR